MAEQRRSRIVRRPDGSLYDEAAMAEWLAAMDRRAEAARGRVRRLSRAEEAPR